MSPEKINPNVNFIDILEPRNTPCGIFKFMTRSWSPQRTFKPDKNVSAKDLKKIVAESGYLDSVIEAESARTGASKEKLKREVVACLEEMGFEQKMHVIRWMGVFFLKMSFMMKVGVYVNEASVLKLKSTMGSNPVLFLPTHRSYADFCLMTYLSYHYDIEFPAVAAGMDFYSMAVVGKLMRETGAFYIRRTLTGAPLYAAALKQYVRTTVAKYPAPVEFFLEGTRSRSNKSLAPKYGMLSMSLAAYFAREVTDITIVPVSISYDRLIETSLFAYEHLGVPKPKESTGGLLRALHNLNDHFGNIYINLGAPISVREYIKDQKLTEEMLKPLELQQLTPEQFNKVQDIAHYVITKQQDCSVATISNLLALVLINSIINDKCLHLVDVIKEVQWTIEVLRKLGATVFENDVKTSVERILVVHSKMMKLDQEKRLRLISTSLMEVSEEVKGKMKGHILAAETMVNAVAIIQLQLYVNPVLHHLVPPACISVLVRRLYRLETLSKDYHFIRKLLRYEFFYMENSEEDTFNKSLNYCIQNDVVATESGVYTDGGDRKLRSMLHMAVWPALNALLTCTEVMREQESCEHKKALKLVQQRVESSHCHPYCLSLEATANCLQGLVLVGALLKEKSETSVIYQVEPQILEQCRHLVQSILPDCSANFGSGNSVILDQQTVKSKI